MISWCGHRLENKTGSDFGVRTIGPTHTKTTVQILLPAPSDPHTPMGSKTKVEVEGEFYAQGMDDASAKKAVLAMFEMVFNEDNSNLKNYK